VAHVPVSKTLESKYLGKESGQTHTHMPATPQRWHRQGEKRSDRGAKKQKPIHSIFNPRDLQGEQKLVEESSGRYRTRFSKGAATIRRADKMAQTTMVPGNQAFIKVMNLEFLHHRGSESGDLALDPKLREGRMDSGRSGRSYHFCRGCQACATPWRKLFHATLPRRCLRGIF